MAKTIAIKSLPTESKASTTTTAPVMASVANLAVQPGMFKTKLVTEDLGNGITRKTYYKDD